MFGFVSKSIASDQLYIFAVHYDTLLYITIYQLLKLKLLSDVTLYLLKPRMEPKQLMLKTRVDIALLFLSYFYTYGATPRFATSISMRE